MSLETWQNTWLALMLAPQDRDAILASCPENLTENEYHSLQAIPQTRLEAIADAVQRGRISVLTASLPATLRQLMSSQECQKWAERYAYTYPNAVVYPPAQGLSRWLDWLGQTPEIHVQPWLQEVIHYERLLTQLQFYRKPTPRGIRPKLAPRAGLFVASPVLDVLLFAVERGATAQDIEWLWQERNSSLENQGWLIARWAAEVERISLHWGVYLVVEQLDGQRSWAEIVTDTIQIHPELGEQKAALLAWETWFEKKRFLA